MAESRYESTFIIKGTLEDKDYEPIITKTEDTIKRYGGTVIEMERWGRKKLAYPIVRETQGYYVTVHFTHPGTNEDRTSNIIARLERMFILDESVIRFLTLARPDSVVKGRADMKKRASEVAAKREAAVQAMGDTTVII
jgi:small subunit ribosomal protein S6